MSYFDRNRSLENLPSLSRSGPVPREGRNLDHLHIDPGSSNHGPFNSTAPASVYTHGRHAPTGAPVSPKDQKKGSSYFDLHDQLQMYKEEIDKRDNLISQITSFSPGNSYIKDPAISGYYNPSVDVLSRSETGTLQMKCDKLQSELIEAESRLLETEAAVKRHLAELESVRHTQTSQHALIQSLQQRLEDSEQQIKSFRNIQGRGEVAILSMQQENKEKQESISKLESHLRNSIKERDELEQRNQQAEARYLNLASHVTSVIGHDGFEAFSPGSHEEITSKLSELLKENASLHGKIVMMTEALDAAEKESKANRDTITHLTTSISHDHKQASENSSLMETYRQDKRRGSSPSRPVGEGKGILANTRVCHPACRNRGREHGILSKKDSILPEIQSQLLQAEQHSRAVEIELRTFREQLSAILSDGHHRTPAEEQAIKERLKELSSSSRDASLKVYALEEKSKSLKEQLETQCELHQQAAQRSKRTEGEAEELKGLLQRAEGELMANDVIRNSEKSEKGRYRAFLKKLADVIGMDQFIGELDIDGNALLTRADQLVKAEGDTVSNKSTQLYSLQRKLKGLKQQLESKDLQLEMLRKKVSKLEESSTSRVTLDRDRDDIEARNRRLQKEVEKMRKQTIDQRGQMLGMKAEMAESNNWKTKSEIEQTDMEGNHRAAQAENAVHSFSNEVRNVKASL
ncbi:PREDICTED: coiled-coil domain-containing protein 170-like [Priapulus caudatus]|uniref:Coiled-coil domain-containing protein 170-like n=1 Tax=Priapulus caudatus TaxID=37621 RepID=A0ABM1E676_PRICU|nr:PREDICTED: coiled-coil domain-containing protein 170-like [Priapulus caudatus]